MSHPREQARALLPGGSRRFQAARRGRIESGGLLSFLLRTNFKFSPVLREKWLTLPDRRCKVTRQSTDRRAGNTEDLVPQRTLWGLNFTAVYRGSFPNPRGWPETYLSSQTYKIELQYVLFIHYQCKRLAFTKTENYCKKVMKYYYYFFFETGSHPVV